MPSKYDALARYLAAQSADRVTLTLAEIEAIIGQPLPAGARQRRWWGVPHASPFMLRPVIRAAGWRLVLDAFWGRTPAVTFVRDDTSNVGDGSA